MRPIEGIHHVSAITGDARANVDFYTGVLGLRMIAKTVNQDDPSVYHLFFGDEHASPGCDMTFFEYPGARPGRAGAGMVHTIVWRVADETALEFWRDRFTTRGIEHTREGDTLRFADPEGLDHELVIDQSHDPALIAYHPEISADVAIRGFEGVRAYSRNTEASHLLLDELMKASTLDDGRRELRGELRGGWIKHDPPPPTEPGIPGAGTVHHVAFGIHDDQDEAWKRRLAAARIPNNSIVDRNYFRALYFREPGGVLYELSTQGPGFTVDGLSLEELGTKIILPPWLEQHRAVIEPNLTPLPDPRAEWSEHDREQAAAFVTGAVQ
ncbi:MAG: VOC family protein [Gaiellales bacterium]